MSFATVQEWIDNAKAYLYVADIDGDGEPNLPEIEKALQTAFDEMNGWLASRYQEIPNKARATLRMHQIKIATYHLADTAQASTERIEAAYKNAIDYLKAVSAGRADLPGTDQGGGLESGSGGVQMVAPDREFTRDKLQGF